MKAQVLTPADPLAALSHLADASTPSERVAWLARGSASCVPGAGVTALLFVDDALVTAQATNGEGGFALRDSTPQVRDRFFNALARCTHDGIAYVPRGSQQSFSDVSATVGSKDFLFVPLHVREVTLAVVALTLDREPIAADRTKLRAFCDAAARFLALSHAYARENESQRGNERKTLAEAARSILSQTSIAPLAAEMCRLGASLVHADTACVLRWNGERYTCVGTFGGDIERLIKVSGFDLERQAERMADIPDDDRRVQRLIDGPGYVAVPLSRTGASHLGSVTVEAFLLVGNAGVKRFARDDLRLLQELGALLTLALKNLELYEAMSQANRALHESNEFKDDLLAMLAHDFKGPLTAILGCSELLLEGEYSACDEVETIHAQARRLVRLSDDALVLAHTQAPGFSLARSVVDLGAFLADCVDVGAPNSTRVMLDVPGEPLNVELDPQRFRHVIDNLLQNALKYSQREVRVEMRRDDGRAVISVADRGIGIPAAELATLFTRFARASNARKTGVGGSGFGLYVAQKIVAVHGGEIEVVSREHEGTTFSVTLPLAHDTRRD